MTRIHEDAPFTPEMREAVDAEVAALARWLGMRAEKEGWGQPELELGGMCETGWPRARGPLGRSSEAISAAHRRSTASRLGEPTGDSGSGSE